MRISDWSSDVCSSDLSQALALGEPQPPDAAERALRGHLVHADRARGPAIGKAEAVEFVEHPRHRPGRKAGDRSEEHTSELQSLMRISYAVFCLKNKKKQLDSENTQHHYRTLHST